MAQVPRLTTPQVSQAPLSLAPRQATPSLLGVAGRAVAGFAEVQQRLAVNKRTLQVTSMLAGATQKLEEFHLGLSTDRDYETQHQRYEELVKTINADAQRAGDPQLARLFGSEFQPLALRKGFEIQREALKGQVSVQRATVDQTLETIAGLAGSGDPEFDGYLTERGENMLAEAYTNGVLTNAEELQSKASKFHSDVVVAGVRRQIMEAPELAEQQLLTDGFPGLTGDARTVWTERAQSAADSVRRERVATEERQYRLSERAEREGALAAERDGLEMQRAGSLSPDWIETNRDVLTPEAQRYFYRVMSGEEAVTDARVYTDLRERAAAGEDVTDATREALFASRIKQSDYDRIIAIQDREGLPGWYRRGEDFISRSLRPSDLNPDPAAQQRNAFALDDWYEWKKGNPEATEEQASAESRRIVKEYGILDFQSFTLVKRSPALLVGTRNQPDIDATEAATVQAFEAGEMDQDEFNRQALLLSEWREAVERMRQQQGEETSGDE
jgi:hypothetical protein